jgi:hypothetical protein
MRLMTLRAEGLESVLGPQGGGFHSPTPLQLGGLADVLVFKEHLDGVVYVSSDLTGPSGVEFEGYAGHEFMVALRSEDRWGANVVARLAQYHLEDPISPGDSMDISGGWPEGSAIRALVFDTYATFSAFDQSLFLLLAIGITSDELAFKLEHGAEALVARLKAAGVHPFTDHRRRSILEPGPEAR